MTLRSSEPKSGIAWLTIGLITGIASVVACGGPDRVDAGATDAGTGTGCCDSCTCTIPDPLTLQGTVDVNVTNTGPIDVEIASPVTVAGPVDVNLVSPSPVIVEVANPLPLDVALVTTGPIDVNVTSPIVAAPAPAVTFRGVTSTSFLGTGGYSAMNSACNAEYAGSRMCSTTTLLDLYPAPIPSVDAWVWSRVVAVLAGSAYNEIGAASSGSPDWVNCSSGPGTAPFTASINYWNGTIIATSGDVMQGNCYDSHAVACCGYAP